MSLWAIAYDLDVKGMKKAGYTKSKVTLFYNAIRSCLATNKFDKFKQLSIYTSAKSNSLTDAFQVCIDLKKIADTDKFIKRFHLFRIEDFNDLLPLVSAGHKSDEKDPVEEEIEEVFAEEAA
jgi:virulence-associated protein VapD